MTDYDLYQEYYMCLFNIDPELLTKIVKKFKDITDNKIFNIENRDYGEAVYDIYTEIQDEIINNLQTEYGIYDKTKQTYIILYFYLLMGKQYKININETNLEINLNLDCIINIIIFIVIKYYTENDEIFIFDKNIFLFISDMLFNNSYYKYLFVEIFLNWLIFYKNYNFLILFDYLFITDFFNNIKCYSRFNNYKEPYLGVVNILNDCFYTYAIN